MLVLNARVRAVDQLAFAHDGGRLYTAGTNAPDLRLKPDNRGIDVWEIPGRADPTGRLFPDALIAGLAVNPASGWLYVGTGFEYPSGDDERPDDSGYFALPPAGGEPTRLGLTGGNAFTLAVPRSGRWLVAAGYDRPWQPSGGWRNQRLVRWRQPAGRPPVKQWDLPSRGRYDTSRVACDPAGARVVTHDFLSGKVVPDLEYDLRVRDPATGRAQTKVPIPARTVAQILFSPDGMWLVVRAGPSLVVWDARDLGRTPHKVRGGKMHFTGIAFHPPGKYLAATSNDTTVKLYDTATWQVAKTFTWDVGRLRSVAFSPDGTLAAVGSDTGKVVLWDVDL